MLTDGCEWSFYLPGGLGSYEDRRVYRLQIDDREPAKCEQMLSRYFSGERVRNQSAFEAAQRDDRDAARRREAAGNLPRAWRELTADAHDQLLEALTDKAEALCGYKPAPDEVTRFLRGLRPAAGSDLDRAATSPNLSSEPPSGTISAQVPPAPGAIKVSIDRSSTYSLHGQPRTAPNASETFVEILRAVGAGHEDKLRARARAVSGTKINHIGRFPQEINAAKPHLARAWKSLRAGPWA